MSLKIWGVSGKIGLHSDPFPMDIVKNHQGSNAFFLENLKYLLTYGSTVVIVLVVPFLVSQIIRINL